MKVWNYVFIAVTLMLVLTFLGIRTGITPLLDLIGFDYNMDTQTFGNMSVSDSTITDVLFGGSGLAGILAVLAVAAGAVIVGLFAKASTENLILLPFITGTLVLFIQTFAGIINFSIGTFPVWMSAVIMIIFVPFTIGFIIALAEFFRGSD